MPVRDIANIPLSLNDCLQLDRYMINGVHLRILMLRNQPEFCLMSDDNDDGNQTGYQYGFKTSENED